MDRILKRIQTALAMLDLGIPNSRFKDDFLGVLNQALREVGGTQVQNLEDEGALVRAMLTLEAEV